MSTNKRRKIDGECRAFNKTWTAKYLFTEVKGKAVCLVCGTQVAVFKEYNLSRHYATKHADKYKNLSEEEQAKESDALLAKLQSQQNIFTKRSTSRDAAVETSYVLSHKNAKRSKPWFVKINVSKVIKKKKIGNDCFYCLLPL